MSYTKTIGNDRLGSGGKMKVDLKTYERSTHNLSYLWRSTMASGTLVPFMTELALPGDTFDIDLDTDIKTHPTVGPLFGSYKVQLDVFQCPIRLYNAQLHNNALGIGLKMANVKLPQIRLIAKKVEDPLLITDNYQINPSCLLSYLNIRGVGLNKGTTNYFRNFSAIPYIAYWDIYKNYYANKQEEVGAFLHTDPTIVDFAGTVEASTNGTTWTAISKGVSTMDYRLTKYAGLPSFRIPTPTAGTTDQVLLITDKGMFKLREMFYSVSLDGSGNLQGTGAKFTCQVTGWTTDDWNGSKNVPKIDTFPLSNIDSVRDGILKQSNSSAYTIVSTSQKPFSSPLQHNKTAADADRIAMEAGQEGLALKTYQSDLFNNWMSTEWLDGTTGINSITAVDTSAGKFTIDQLQLAKKVYDMLNRIAISGGTYDDWLDAVYNHDRPRSAESPIYEGGLIKDIVFQEVISNAEAGNAVNTQPLGTLAGRGVMGNRHKGGKMVIRVDEPSYIMGIISITPRIDYSQGNKWDTNLKTMDELHKPALDQIGFQDLITEQMAWWDTEITASDVVKRYSAGKQPAWMNYMTNVNQVRGNFADPDNEMFMTLNRKYEITNSGRIKDLTTYIDPRKFNNVFAMTNRDAQNFWVQVAVDITARRKMSAKVMPNL